MSQNSKYSYLLPFCSKPEDLKISGAPMHGKFYLDLWDGDNIFIALTKDDIEENEKRLGFNFPPALKEFYLEIGYGFFGKPFEAPENYAHYYRNRLMDPCSVADIKLLGHDSGQILLDVEFEPGDLPIFEIADGGNFLLMRPQSDKPNAVYGMLGELIEEDFEKFIWRLYYESPIYYMEIWRPLINPINQH